MYCFLPWWLSVHGLISECQQISGGKEWYSLGNNSTIAIPWLCLYSGNQNMIVAARWCSSKSVLTGMLASFEYASQEDKLISNRCICEFVRTLKISIIVGKFTLFMSIYFILFFYPIIRTSYGWILPHQVKYFIQKVNFILFH